MPNLLPSILRTYVPLIVGWLLGLPLVVQLENLFGVAPADRTAWLSRLLQVAITALYYLAARLLEHYVWPKFSVLLGSLKVPAYTPADNAVVVDLDPDPAPEPAADEAAADGAIDVPDEPDAGHITIQQVFYALAALAALVLILVALGVPHLHRI